MTLSTCPTCKMPFIVGTFCTHALEAADISTMDSGSVKGLAEDALTIALAFIQAKLGGRPGDIAGHMFPSGNAAEALLSSYIEAEIDCMIESEDPDNFEETTHG